MSLYDYTKDQCRFLSTLMIKIEGEIPAIKPLDDLKSRREEFDCGWNDHLKNLSSLEVLRIFTSTELEDRSREIAIRRLSVLLSDHTSEKVPIDIAEMRQIQPLLISCLKEEGISDSMFKVLGEVVNHVTYEMMVYHDDKCYELSGYITGCKIEFERVVYVFQCVRMPLSDDNFVNPVLENLLPMIRTRLDPPREFFVDHICWVLAFMSAFLIENLDYTEIVVEIAHKMINSVRKLVERGMEVGILKRTFTDVETIVKKQLEWYRELEYNFLKGLLWRLYAIKGMKWESKIVLWKINVIVEKGVDNMHKELPEEDEFDWLNLTDDVTMTSKKKRRKNCQRLSLIG
ncbi:PREDICTED: uncharacterized protein LOC104728242 [Camelina sativa]|uniref:Uncharacterized protein LOC104728242 n=1 Tax=Camelina sativa TaxID=90675 RepID=A0ABM0USI7_CAMSA|nr:PREDICTED: uncharacterized protein LOC104728242 [Camelina sativa]